VVGKKSTLYEEQQQQKYTKITILFYLKITLANYLFTKTIKKKKKQKREGG
jgi:hypothetical protein